MDESGPYSTMEFLDGQDLQTLAPLPYRDARSHAHDVASALSLLHARRLVHRDVTARNVIVTDSGAKLIDFGALVPMGAFEDIVGTPLYIAPEVALMQAIDGRADLYSLGVVLYQSLTGQFPYRAQTTKDLRGAWSQAPPPPGHLTEGLPAELDRLVSSLIAFERARRPRDGAEVMARLAAGAGLNRTTKTEEAHSYLLFPTLVGREQQSNRLREAIDGRRSARRHRRRPRPALAGSWSGQPRPRQRSPMMP